MSVHCDCFRAACDSPAYYHPTTTSRYEPHAISFTDMFSTACEPPTLVFFNEDEDVVESVDPKGMAMTTIVKELAERGIKARVRTDGTRSAGHSARKSKIDL